MGWAKTFTGPRRAAVVDRLTFGGNIIETGTGSSRLAYVGTQAGQNTRPPPGPGRMRKVPACCRSSALQSPYELMAADKG